MLDTPSALADKEDVIAGSPFGIRSALPEEMPQVASTIAAAFIADRFARFVWSPPHEYLCAIPPFIREFAGGSSSTAQPKFLATSAALRSAASRGPPRRGRSREGHPRYGTARASGRRPVHVREDGPVASGRAPLVPDGDRGRGQRTRKGSRGGADASRRCSLRRRTSACLSRVDGPAWHLALRTPRLRDHRRHPGGCVPDGHADVAEAASAADVSPADSVMRAAGIPDGRPCKSVIAPEEELCAQEDTQSG